MPRQGGRMSGSTLAAAGDLVTLTGANIGYVAAVAAVGVAGLVMAIVYRGEVLAAPTGTEKMQEIARGVQEGASAYLNRQFRTLGIFAIGVFLLLFALPGDTEIRIGRSIFFLVGA